MTTSGTSDFCLNACAFIVFGKRCCNTAFEQDNATTCCKAGATPNGRSCVTLSLRTLFGVRQRRLICQTGGIST